MSPTVSPAFCRSQNLGDGNLVVTLSGDLDLYHVQNLADRILWTLLPGVEHITLDLSEVQYVDSAGLGELVQLYRRAHKLGRKLQVVCQSPQVTYQWNLAHLGTFIPLYVNLTEALTHES